MKRFLQTILLLIILSCLSGCMYYKTTAKYRPGKDDITWAQYNKKNFFIHAEDKVYDLTNVVNKDDTLTGEIGNEWINYEFLKKHPNKGGLDEERAHIIDEVHLHLQNVIAADLKPGTTVKIPYKNIQKLNTFKHDNARTFGNIGLIIATIPVIVLVYAYLTSCPYVYVMQDGSWQMVGEIFGGAVYRPLERHDYMLLPGAGNDYSYQVQISNDLSEIQYINNIELMQIEHPVGTIVIPHRSGKIYTVSDLHLPDKAVSSSNADLSNLISKRDNITFLYNEPPEKTGDSCAYNAMILTCTPPEDADSLKLIIKGGNQIWADYQIDDFTSLFGNKYDNWIKKQNKSDGSEALKWEHDQKLFLDVCVETDTGWRYIDYFELTGPMGRRDLVMPLPVIRTNNKSMRVKLVTGFMFWEVDYAAFDYSKDEPFNVSVVQMLSAITESGQDVSAKISGDDTAYYIQKNIGEKVTITYSPQKVSSDKKATFILHSKGYYEHVRDYTGKPDIKKLLTFTKKGQLSRSSYTNFIKLQEGNLVIKGNSDQ